MGYKKPTKEAWAKWFRHKSNKEAYIEQEDIIKDDYQEYIDNEINSMRNK